MKANPILLLWTLLCAGCVASSNQQSNQPPQPAGPEWQVASSKPIALEVLGNLFRHDTQAARQTLAGARSRGLSEDHFHLLSARVDLAEGRFDKAAQHLNQAAVLAPDLAMVDVLWGRIFESSGQWLKARKAFMTALEKGHLRNDALLAAVRASVAAGDLSFAVNLLEAELSLNAYDADLLRALGMVQLAAGEAELALTPLREAHALQPLRSDTLFQLVGALAAAGRHREVVEELGGLGPESMPPHILQTLARAHMRGGDADAAIVCLNLSHTLRPTDSNIALDLLRAHLLADDTSGALVTAHRVEGTIPDSHRLRILIGQAHCLAGDHARARASFRRALDLGASRLEVDQFLSGLPRSPGVDLATSVLELREGVR